MGGAVAFNKKMRDRIEALGEELEGIASEINELLATYQDAEDREEREGIRDELETQLREVVSAGENAASLVLEMME
jgi:hypothetical protein